MGDVRVASVEPASPGDVMAVGLLSKLKPVFPEHEVDMRRNPGGDFWQIVLRKSLFDTVVLAETCVAAGEPPHGILVYAPEIFTHAKAVADAYARQSGRDVVVIESYVDGVLRQAVQPAAA